MQELILALVLELCVAGRRCENGQCACDAVQLDGRCLSPVLPPPPGSGDGQRLRLTRICICLFLPGRYQKVVLKTRRSLYSRRSDARPPGKV